jgi:hypothetical protein
VPQVAATTLTTYRIKNIMLKCILNFDYNKNLNESTIATTYQKNVADVLSFLTLYSTSFRKSKQMKNENGKRKMEEFFTTSFYFSRNTQHKFLSIHILFTCFGLTYGILRAIISRFLECRLQIRCVLYEVRTYLWSSNQAC